MEIAHYLDNHQLVDKVHYPGLPSHKNHKIAAIQQNKLFGGVVSFSLKGDSSEQAVKFTTNTKYFKLAESLGGVKSLLCLPSKMTHASIPRDKRLQSGIQDSLIRLSCGIEDAADLIKDLDHAFNLINVIKEVLV